MGSARLRDPARHRRGASAVRPAHGCVPYGKSPQTRRVHEDAVHEDGGTP